MVFWGIGRSGSFLVSAQADLGSHKISGEGRISPTQTWLVNVPGPMLRIKNVRSSASVMAATVNGCDCRWR